MQSSRSLGLLILLLTACGWLASPAAAQREAAAEAPAATSPAARPAGGVAQPRQAPPPATSLQGYIPCLGCAEHHEIETRWHRPFLVELAGEGLLMFDHFRLEREARDMGLCETDILIRSSRSVGGCHPYSATRAWLLEAPLEILAFTSPAWGLERDGHPRWAMALEMVPIVYHGLAVKSTIHSIHQWQRLKYLYQ